MNTARRQDLNKWLWLQSKKPEFIETHIGLGYPSDQSLLITQDFKHSSESFLFWLFPLVVLPRIKAPEFELGKLCDYLGKELGEIKVNQKAHSFYSTLVTEWTAGRVSPSARSSPVYR